MQKLRKLPYTTPVSIDSNNYFCRRHWSFSNSVSFHWLLGKISFSLTFHKIHWLFTDLEFVFTDFSLTTGYPVCLVEWYIVSGCAASAFSQWDTVLFCNEVSNWLGASLESVLVWLKCMYLLYRLGRRDCREWDWQCRSLRTSWRTWWLASRQSAYQRLHDP